LLFGQDRLSVSFHFHGDSFLISSKDWLEVLVRVDPDFRRESPDGEA
jgi:hypothetical protein